MNREINLTQSDLQNVYVVLGMPRSGTSAVASGLKALGIYLGNELIPAKTRWNAKGYFEDKDIVREINEKILRTVCDEWETVKILDKNTLCHADLDKFRKKALTLIKQRYGDQTHWGYKDPRTARLLPFWQSIFAELQLQDNYVIVLRNPLASAHSFKKLTHVDLEKALLLWLAHLIPAIDETHGKSRIVISYDLLLEDPCAQLKRLQHYFNLESVKQTDLDNYAHEFLDKQLKHYEFTYDDFQTHEASGIIPVGLKIYDLLLKLAKDQLIFTDDEFIQTWKEIKLEFQQLYPIYCYVDNLLKRNKEQERTLRAINKSLPWKMIYPLRAIENKLRQVWKNRDANSAK